MNDGQIVLNRSIEIRNKLYDFIDKYHIACNSLFDNKKNNERASVTSGVKFDLSFEIRNLNYPGIYVHIASNHTFSGL